MADPLPFPSGMPTQELLGVAVEESHEPMLAPLIHLACTRCHADVWWPADLAADLRCPQCGGGLQPPAAPAPPDGLLLEQARAAHRLERLAAALDRLTVDDLDALRYVVDTPPVPAAEARLLRERARHAVAVLADLIGARDARV